ncbi:MAG TPA: inositol 2-dehydrogenase [Deinococcales bacterium]|nr:inositol 2-dehydrogenase [Deinococcales bacterium]
MKSTYGLAILGCGRMGIEHGRNILAVPSARIVAVADPVPSSRDSLQALTRAERSYDDPEAAIADPNVDAVVIVTPTPTHADLIEAAARAGKAIFCEKPVALSVERTERCLAAVEAAGVPFQIGFQRRYDPPYRKARERLEAGDLGTVDQFRATGRDPAPPPLEYLKASGGQFLDQGVHDFDVARFLVGEVEEVMAWGAVRVDPAIGELGDCDTSTTLLRFRNGALGVIENSRRSAYGYDVVTEVFGSQGKLLIDDTPKTALWQYSAGRREGADGRLEADHYRFFMDRFKDAYRLEIEAFLGALASGRQPTPGPRDALESLRLAIAARTSYQERRPVRVEEVR